MRHSVKVKFLGKEDSFLFSETFFDGTVDDAVYVFHAFLCGAEYWRKVAGDRDVRMELLCNGEVVEEDTL